MSSPKLVAHESLSTRPSRFSAFRYDQNWSILAVLASIYWEALHVQSSRLTLLLPSSVFLFFLWVPAGWNSSSLHLSSLFRILQQKKKKNCRTRALLLQNFPAASSLGLVHKSSPSLLLSCSASSQKIRKKTRKTAIAKLRKTSQLALTPSVSSRNNSPLPSLVFSRQQGSSSKPLPP
jgi:hypothetical protein